MTIPVKLGFLGAGQMAEALTVGFINKGVVKSNQVCCHDISQQRMEVFVKLGSSSKKSNEEVVKDSDIIFVCTKPQYVKQALESSSGTLNNTKTLVSIAAGITTTQLEDLTGHKCGVIRVMPNTPCLVGACAAAMCVGQQVDVDPVHVDAVMQLMSAVGTVNTLPENLMDAVTGLSGSGPAYGFVIIEALADGGVKAGLPRDVAQKLAAQTMLGAATMVLQSGKHPGQLKDMVTSPGGTTIAGVHQLESSGVRAAMMNAVHAACQRSQELSGK